MTWRDFLWSGWFFSIALFLLFLCLIRSAMYLAERDCFESWKRSGMGISWGVMGGCQVSLPDGTWIPADHYKVVR